MNPTDLRNLSERAMNRARLVVGNLPVVRTLVRRWFHGTAHRIAQRLYQFPGVDAVNLRGSGARGNVRLGRSDLDYTVIIPNQNGETALAWLKRFWQLFVRLRAQESVLKHLYILTRDEYAAAAHVGAAYCSGAGEIKRLAGQPEPAALHDLRDHDHLFTSLWFAILKGTRFYPRVLWPGRAASPVAERDQANLRHCYNELLAPRPHSGEVSHPSLRWLLEHCELAAWRDTLWIAQPRRLQLKNYEALLRFLSDLGETVHADDYRRLRAAGCTGHPWTVHGAFRRSEASSGFDLLAEKVRSALRSFNLATVVTTHSPWQRFDPRCYLLFAHVPHAAQLGEMSREIQRMLVAEGNPADATFPLPIGVTPGMLKLGGLFPKAPLDVLTFSGSKAPVLKAAASLWTTNPAAQEVLAHGFYMYLIEQAGFARRKLLEIAEGKEMRFAGRLLDWSLCFFPAARLFACERILVLDASLIKGVYLERFDDPTCKALEKLHARFGDVTPAELAAGDLGSAYDEIYPTLHDMIAPTVVSIARVANPSET